MSDINIPKVAFVKLIKKEDVNEAFAGKWHQRMSFKITPGSVVYFKDYELGEQLKEDTEYEALTHAEFNRIRKLAREGKVVHYDMHSDPDINNDDVSYNLPLRLQERWTYYFFNEWQRVCTGTHERGAALKVILEGRAMTRAEYIAQEKGKVLEFFSDYLIFKHKIKTVGKMGRFVLYTYDNGIYNSEGQPIIESDIQNTLGILCDKKVVSELVEKIKNKSHTGLDHLENEENKVCLLNGVLDIKTRELTPYDPELVFLNKLPVKYNKKARCWEFFKFLGQAFRYKGVEAVNTIGQWYGYTLTNGNKFKKAIIMEGPKDTGKTTLIKHYLKMFGMENNAGQSLQEICGDKFSVANLYGKRVNVYDDLQAIALKDIGKFKIVTGDSPVSGRYIYGHSFSFWNDAKLLFACNVIPKAEDADLAYFGRWLPLCMDNVCKNPDRELLNKITTEEEMSGVLNWALQMLNKLEMDNHFAYNPSDQEVKDYMMRSGSNVMEFINEYCVQEPGLKVLKKPLYEGYQMWIDYMIKKTERTDKYKMVSQTKFTQEIKHHLDRVSDGQKWVEDKDSPLDPEGKHKKHHQDCFINLGLLIAPQTMLEKVSVETEITPKNYIFY